MERNYLVLLNYAVGEIVKIKLTDEEKQLTLQYNDFEEFFHEYIADKYQLRLKDCEWMVLDTIKERTFNF